MKILNISGYRFMHLEALTEIQTCLKALCEKFHLKGTILLSTEGVNINLAGFEETIHPFILELQTLPSFENFEFKTSISDFIPFKRLWIKLKKEVIAFKQPSIKVSTESTDSITPHELHQWLEENRDFCLLDTRNDYEYKIGTFKNATTLPIKHFSDLPKALETSPLSKEKPVVMFCTGGIRCEKALPLLQAKGFNQVYQLQGGILNYLQNFGAKYYEGECFVFDDRIAVDAKLETTSTELCTQCQMPVTYDEQVQCDFAAKKLCLNCSDRYNR